jgi:hypothetical protein
MQQVKLTDEEGDDSASLAVRKFLRNVTLQALFIVKHQRKIGTVIMTGLACSSSHTAEPEALTEQSK